MRHLLGVPIRGKTTVFAALCEVPGLGRRSALDICENLGLQCKAPWGALKEPHYLRLRRRLEIYSNQIRPLAMDYERSKQRTRAQLIALGSFRGIRLRVGLPVRGQNTHSNSRTARRRRS